MKSQIGFFKVSDSHIEPKKNWLSSWTSRSSWSNELKLAEKQNAAISGPIST